MVTTDHHEKRRNLKTKKREARYYTDEYIPCLLLWILAMKNDWFACGWVYICFLSFFFCKWNAKFREGFLFAVILSLSDCQVTQ